MNQDEAVPSHRTDSEGHDVSDPRDSANADRPRAVRAVPLTIVAIVVAVLAGGAWLLHASEAAVNDVALADEPKLVSAVPARAASFRATRRFLGTLEPWQAARIGPQLASGFVGSVLVRPGSVVQRGQVLATLDCRNASAASRATSMQAKALEARLRAVTQEGARIAEMMDGGFVSANELEQRQATAAETAAKIEAIMAQARGRQLEVDDCVLRAPFAGEVAERNVDPGAFVRPGSALLSVVDRDIVRLVGDAPEVDYKVVAPETPVRIRLLSTGQTLHGVIARRSPAGSASTRTIRFEVDLADAGRSIPVGTTAEIEIDVGEPQPAVEVPLRAASIRGSRATLFVVEGRQAKKRVLDVVGEQAGSAFVSAELAGGSLVVLEGRGALRDGDWVAAKAEEWP